MKLAHIRSGSIIARYLNGTGFVTLSDGSRVSPPEAGYVNGVDKIVPIVEEVTDTSTPGQPTRTARVETLEADRLLVEVTIRDASAQEVSDEKDARFERMDQLQNVLTLNIVRRLYAIQQNLGITNAQMNTAISNSPIDGPFLKNYAIGLLP